MSCTGRATHTVLAETAKELVSEYKRGVDTFQNDCFLQGNIPGWGALGVWCLQSCGELQRDLQESALQ